MEKIGRNALKLNKLITNDISRHLNGQPADYKILEVSCGKGYLSKQLQDFGYNVSCTNYDAKPIFEELKCDMVDLNKGLPYQNDFFDAIICVEVIEHLPNVVSTLKEFKRVLKKNGLCIVTTPNVLNLSSRVRFLLSGFMKSYSSPYKLTVSIPDAHINLLTFPELEFLVVKENFLISELKIWKIKFSSVLLYPIFSLPIIVSTFFYLFLERYNHPEFGKATKNEKKRNWHIFKSLLSFRLLLGENIEMILLPHKS